MADGFERALSGWGLRNPVSSRLVAPATAAHAEALLERSSPDRNEPLIARGLGRSYGDAAQLAGGLVADTTRLVDLCWVDRSVGLVSAEAGVTIGQLIDDVVPEGWFVPVTPGTRHVTMGGAIAADIHGKNHHLDGTLGAHVREIELVVANGTRLTVSPEGNHEDRALFWATVGGMGLTGIITRAELQLVPIETARIVSSSRRFDAFDDLLDAMASDVSPFSVAWIDIGGRGRSVLDLGRFATADELPSGGAEDPLEPGWGRTLRLPLERWPKLINATTVRAFNTAWFRRAPKRTSERLRSLRSYFHPLDGVDGWNRLYGREGFLQWQVVVPTGAEDTLRTCIERLGAAHAPSFLTVLKRFGPANAGPLSFPLEGWTLAVDLPAGDARLDRLLDELDRDLAEAGGRVYLAKDSRLDPSLVEAMYPRIDEWREVVHRFDPDRRFQSDLSRRLALT